MPQWEEGTVYWSNDDDKTTEQQSAIYLSQVCENEALLQGKWNEIYSFELARNFLIVFATSLSLT